MIPSQREAVIKIFQPPPPKKDSRGPEGFSTEFYRTFKKTSHQYLKLLHKIHTEGTLPGILWGHGHPDADTQIT